MNVPDLPACWSEALAAEFNAPYFSALRDFVRSEREAHSVFPPEGAELTALRLTPLSGLRVVILGQDPYHDDGQAHGLSFSVPEGVKIPPSLRNIYKELESDLGHPPATHGDLSAWAAQGVLLLNTVCTVRAHAANSHRGKGWETFTSRVIACANELPSIAFVLWGKPAQKSEALIDTSRHLVIKSAHPSPLSARNGFFGSKPFSQINTFLESTGRPGIDWRIG